MKMICAFSSDYRELYKADIYRALALPSGHILHFRYKKKYVDENLIASGTKLKNRDVVIFYTHGNKEQNPLTHVSIRKATVIDHYVSADTDVLHVFMKLGDFCNVRVDTANSTEKMPLTKFFAELNCTSMHEEHNWQARVTAIKDLLPPLTYFQIKGISCGGTHLPLRYSNDGRSCFYRLKQGTRHILHLALGNPNSTSAKVNVGDSGDDIAINIIRPLETSAQFDDVDVPLIVQNLQVFSKPALLSFQPVDQPGTLAEYATNIELDMHGGFAKPTVFGLLSTSALAAIFVAQPRSPDSTLPSAWVLVGAALVLWIASSFLYYWFNKK